jgi:hypothetical protein
LKYLDCSDNRLRTLDVTKNTSLEILGCSRNQLGTLDVTKNTALMDLDCDGNQLLSIAPVDPSCSVMGINQTRKITIKTNTIDLRDYDPNIEADKIEVNSGATKDGTRLRNLTNQVKYTYHTFPNNDNGNLYVTLNIDSGGNANVQKPPAKKAQPMTVKASARTLKVKKLKKKAQTVAPFIVGKAQGKVTYSVISGNVKSRKVLILNARNGKITVRKKTKKGTYSIKVRVTAAGNSAYNSGSKIVTVTVLVKK